MDCRNVWRPVYIGTIPVDRQGRCGRVKYSVSWRIRRRDMGHKNRVAVHTGREEMKKCCYCGADAIIHTEAGLYYARCSKYNEHGLYTFLGQTIRSATEQWNDANGERKREFRRMCRDAQVMRSRYEYRLAGAPYDLLCQVAAIAGIKPNTILGAFKRNGILEGEVLVGGIKIQRFFKRNKGAKKCQ